MKWGIGVFLIALDLVLFSLSLLAGAGQTSLPEAGIEEKTGSILPEGLLFQDEYGRTVRLPELVSDPAILSFAYYDCSSRCGRLLSGLSDIMDKIGHEPGYSAITVSIDDSDTPGLALKRKRDYIRQDSIPDDRWHFLTGDAGNIGRLAEAVGLRFRRTSSTADGFDHPFALIVLSPDGPRVIRYIYGRSFNAADVEMALREASSGASGPSRPALRLLCLGEGAESYAINVMKLAGIGVLFSVAFFFIYLNVSGRSKKI